MSLPFRLLHIADPHFGRCHFLTGSSSEIGERHAQELQEVLVQNGLLPRPFDAIILSGDFTFACQPGGFDAAVAFIDRVAPLVKPHGMLIVPGNHDIDLGVPVVIGNLSLPTSKREAEAPFRNFLARVEPYVGSPNFRLSSVIRIPRAGSSGLVLAGLNSCRVERRDAQGWGYIGVDQIYEVGATLSGRDVITQARKGDAVIAVTHHNLLPIWDLGLQVLAQVPQKRKFSFVMDAGGALTFLSDLGIGALIHGHTHVQSDKRIEGYGSDQDRQSATTLVLGTGSLGVAQERGDPPHHFRILEVSNGMLRYQDLTALFHQRDTARVWNVTKMTNRRSLVSFWDPKQAESALKTHLTRSHSASFDSETLDSWAQLRAKVLKPGEWNRVFAKLCERVRAIVPGATEETISRVLDEIFTRPPSESDLCNFSLEQCIIRRMAG